MSLNNSSTTLSYHQAVFSKTVSKPKVRLKRRKKRERKKEEEKKKGGGKREKSKRYKMERTSILNEIREVDTRMAGFNKIKFLVIKDAVHPVRY